MHDWEAALIVEEAELEAQAAIYPNPPCLPWCTTKHAAWEWAHHEGRLYCSADVARGTGWGISVTGTREAIDRSDLTSPVVDLADLEVRIDVHGSDEGWLPLAKLDAFAGGINTAREFVRVNL